ncbi:hypothetical protein L596_023115 [Steinernema carpocapsae]|uniref:Protein OSCP1 n=2 Tax=Steinernema carpocapsae TaxID=34508 RepID=A0A4V5ZZB1_STECR|nr:hypothetical protein L596_023115 [Steinernema carpocapsae]
MDILQNLLDDEAYDLKMDFAVPLIYFNMGAEMIYILHQRLSFQIKGQKHNKVLADIVATMLSPTVIKEVIERHEEVINHHKDELEGIIDPDDIRSPIYDRLAFKAVFTKIAHSSIMRINGNSMDKLFDLMTMSFKYQVQMCADPQHLLILTLNHFDGIRELVPYDEECQRMINNAHDKVITLLYSQPTFMLVLARQMILNYFLDCKVKISHLLKNNLQKPTGEFVLKEELEKVSLRYELPGTVSYYDKGSLHERTRFDPMANYHLFYKVVDDMDLAYSINRNFPLGKNLFLNSDESPQVTCITTADPTETTAFEEMTLLQSLIKPRNTSAQGDNFELDLFGEDVPDEGTEETIVKESPEKAVLEKAKKIDASKKKSLNKAMEEMTVGSQKKKPPLTTKKSKGQDMLDMLDQAAKRPPTGTTTRKTSIKERRPSPSSRPASRSSSAKRKPSK